MLPAPVLLARWDDFVAALIAVIDRGNALLSHPLVTALQFHGVYLACLLATLWVLAGRARLRELQRQRRRSPGCGAGARRGSNSGSSAALAAAEQEAGEARLPGVAVVLPVHGCRSHSVANWEAILALAYDGPLEFLFVLQDKSDPAHAVISGLVARQAQQAQQGLARARPARILSAGAAERTSQKIHNLLEGIRAAPPEAAYLLCLDDDVLLHPGLLAALVRDMQGDASLFMATGYPFDVPAAGADLLSYAALSYHLPLIVPFSERTEFVWGGCMLFRAAEMRHDPRGILQAWSEGGYSDDLTVASRCTEQGLTIYCPGYAIFPQWLDGCYPPRRWWNYLRRQLYVMDTYSNAHNRRTNHGLAAFHAYASWGVVLPAAAVLLRLLLWALAAALLPTQHVYGGPAGSSYLWLRVFGLAPVRPWSLASLAVFSLSLAYLAAALRWMTRIILELFLALNPALKRHQLHTFCWPKLWAGFLLSNAVIPLCIAYTFLTSHIDWSDIRYWRRGGRVVRVQH